MDAARDALVEALAGRFPWEGCDAGDAEAMRGAALEHGVERLLWERLRGLDASAATGLRESLDATVRVAAARELLVQRELRQVLWTLAAAGVHTLVVKGAALAYSAYHQPWLRPRTDTDLLVSRTQLDLAARVLEGCGYLRSAALSTGELVSHQVAFERDDEHGVHHVLDLHWKIVNPQLLADTLPFDDMWRDRVRAPALGPDAAVPSRVHGLALACIHRLAHHQGNDRLIWRYDIELLAAATGDVEWEALVEVAGRAQIGGLCLAGLHAARAAFGTRIPDDVERALDEGAVSEPSRVYLQGRIRPRDVLRSDLSLLPSRRARVRLLFEHAFPPPSFMKQRYGAKGPWALPALYVHRLVTGASRWVKS